MGLPDPLHYTNVDYHSILPVFQHHLQTQVRERPGNTRAKVMIAIVSIFPWAVSPLLFRSYYYHRLPLCRKLTV